MVFKYSKFVPEIPWLLLKNILRWSIQKRDTRVTTRCKNHNWNNSICDKIMYKTDNEIRNYEMLSKDSMFIREIARIVEQYLNDPDIQWIILNFGERETEEARKQGSKGDAASNRRLVAQWLGCPASSNSWSKRFYACRSRISWLYTWWLVDCN